MNGHDTSQGRRCREHGMRRAWLLLALVAPGVLALVLAGCGVSTDSVPGVSTSTASATPTLAPPMGTLVGQVVASPTCPVEPVAHPCSPAPVPHRPVTVQTPAGKQVETVTTDSGGHFSAILPSGSYVLRVAIQPGTVGIRQVSPGAITIVAGKTTTVTIEVDTGIR